MSETNGKAPAIAAYARGLFLKSKPITDKERIAALEAKLAAAQARADKLDYAFGLSEKATRQATEIAAAAQAVIAQKNEALDRLAKLGNGDRYGNSEGNHIAQQAIAIPSDRSCLDAMLAEARKEALAGTYTRGPTVFRPPLKAADNHELLEDRIHRENGIARAAKSVKAERGEK